MCGHLLCNSLSLFPALFVMHIQLGTELRISVTQSVVMPSVPVEASACLCCSRFMTCPASGAMLQDLPIYRMFSLSMALER